MEPTGEITITLESDERRYAYDDLSVTFSSSDQEIIDALHPTLLEDVGLNLKEAFEDGAWMVKRVEATHNTFIFPKSTAGCVL